MPWLPFGQIKGDLDDTYDMKMERRQDRLANVAAAIFIGVIFGLLIYVSG
jgi:hypothetical protein